MGLTGSVAVVRWEGALEDVEMLAPAVEDPPYDPMRRGPWWVVPVEEVDLENDLRSRPGVSLPLLVAATGGPALGFAVNDSSWATITGHSAAHGTWFTTLPQGISPAAWEYHTDEDIGLEILDVPRAVEAATLWAEAAGLTPYRNAVADVLRNTGYGAADEVVMNDFLDVLGLPPEDVDR